jgi:aspartyl-tRNA(Asn)/glutamyl-tRNA(Gln) amidotransferase subunit C
MSNDKILDREKVARVASLARLSLTTEELDQFTAQLSQVLDHAGEFANLNLDGLAPMSHAFAISNVLRADIVSDGLDRDSVLSQAPSVEDGRFRVPKIVGEAP